MSDDQGGWNETKALKAAKILMDKGEEIFGEDALPTLFGDLVAFIPQEMYFKFQAEFMENWEID
jgi:hypothetical protein